MAFVVVLLLNVSMAIFVVLKWYSEFTEVTKDGIMRHSGILYKKEQKYACNFVEVVTVDQSFMGMIFHYGTLELYDPSLKEKVYLSNIAEPKKYGKMIELALTNGSDRSMPFIAT